MIYPNAPERLDLPLADQLAALARRVEALEKRLAAERSATPVPSWDRGADTDSEWGAGC
jgi:hypothetical protein